MTEALHDQYPMQRIRVVRQGKASTISMDWDTYSALLANTPGKSPGRLAALFRREVVLLEANGRVKGLSEKAVEAVRLRLAETKEAANVEA